MRAQRQEGYGEAGGGMRDAGGGGRGTVFSGQPVSRPPRRWDALQLSLRR
jgi:hypothetical protein